jgi:molybdopterin/thiamine biosynthesis adenylyltransferase
MTDAELLYSRPLATAASLGEIAEDRHRFVDKRVLLTGEPSVLATENGRTCMLASMRLLPRICSKVDVSIPADMSQIRAACEQVVRDLAFGTNPVLLDEPPTVSSYDAVLSVGSNARGDLNWTVVNSEGWLARVSSGHKSLPDQCSRTNPVGAVGAACLGTAEVFKRLLRVNASRGPLLDGLTFSLFNYRTGAAAEIGPQLPERLTGEPLIVGAGAIGNGIVYLLHELRLRGHTWIIDPQVFVQENLGTCIAISTADIDLPKAQVMANYLKPMMNVSWYQEPFAIFKSRFGIDVPYPQVVLNGLDNIEARHAVQGMWPDLVIDGAIGPFTVQVSRHPWAEDVACLRCLYKPASAEPADQRASGATGLSPERVNEPDQFVTEADVRLAPSERQAWLADRLGQPICSVVQEGIARELSQEQQRAGFEPSVPFVAGLSACMVAGEFVKYLAEWPTPLAPRFQMDLLQGPQCGMKFPEARHPDCLCVNRRHNIDTIRSKRQ